MQRVVLYLDPRSLNDATKYYVKIISTAISNIGGEFIYVFNINEVKRNDIIFTITAKYFFKALVAKYRNKTIYWAQGIAPEEYLLSRNNQFVYFFKRLIEAIAIRNANLVFLVTKPMLDHYRDKYKYHKSNFIIMPCYNLRYQEMDINMKNDKYFNPSFVYAGSLSAWQCIEETLQIFKIIESNILNATLTILSSEIEYAEKLIKKYGIINAKVKYVPLNELPSELIHYKYGFLIRDDIKVNNVASPTKMNSYLASGVIPIYTDAITDFIYNIKLYDFSLVLNASLSIQNKAFQIISYENKVNDYSRLEKYIKAIFESYYNDENYVVEIEKKIKHIFITNNNC